VEGAVTATAAQSVRLVQALTKRLGTLGLCVSKQNRGQNEIFVQMY
jgi:hypothetical protein